MIFAYDHRGMIVTEFHVQQVTTAYYRDWIQKIAQKNAQKLA